MKPAPGRAEEKPDGNRHGGDAVTPAELEDARLGFFHLLARRYGREFKERHGDDLFAQAAFEFSRKLEKGEEIRNPAAWITHCAWNRAKTEYESRSWRPRTVSTENLLAEPVAEETWQPEESFLSEDRMRKIRDAIDRLPLDQRELIARTYFEGESVRAAARRLGWSEGKGARAHNSARKKLRGIIDELGGPAGIEIDLGLACFFSLSAAGRGAAAEVPTGLEGALQRVGRGLSDGWHRTVEFARHPLGGRGPTDPPDVTPGPPGRVSQLGRRIVTSPVAETAASAGDGPGRVAEVCKALAVCAITGTAAVTAGVIGEGGGHPHHHHGGPAAASKPVARPAKGGGPVERVVPTREAASPEVTTAESEQPSEVPHAPAADRGGPTHVSHSVSESRTASGTSTDAEKPPAGQHEEAESSSAREAFGAFEERGEADPVESGSGAGTDSLSTAESSSPAPEPTEAPSASPKASAEKQVANEQFHGGLR